jgi:parvulin-like peptidyl-prolyl isomerase
MPGRGCRPSARRILAADFVRIQLSSSIAFSVGLVTSWACHSAHAQGPVTNPPAQITPSWNADSASLDGCQIIARIDSQIVLACEVLWEVNLEIERRLAQMPPEVRVPPEQLQEFRREAMRHQVALLLNRKLVYDQFRRTVPPEKLADIEEKLLEPFHEQEVPQLMKQLKVDDQQELERELIRLGSSLADVRRSFNEQFIFIEWVRSKVKINEEVSPDQLLEYYQEHLADYDYPAQARWEELMVRKNRFSNTREAYAEIARLGNEVWQRGTAQGLRGPAFTEIAKAKSDGFTAKDGGIQDWTSKGALKATAIDQALFSLQLGQMSPILESDDGYHIVRVLERKEAGREPFTEVQAKIRDKLKEQRFKSEVDKYLASLRRDARIWTAFTGNVSADVLLGRKPDESQSQ